jgi:acyl carrier protein
VPPRTPTERAVAGVWAAVLGRDQVGAHDDFFELGGHSLLATRLVGRLQARLAVTVPVLTVLRHPTVRSLTRQLVTARRDHRVEDNGREVRP